MKRIKAWISNLILKIIGWKVEYHFPLDTPKAIFVVAPHTSMWDFPLGILARNILGIHIGFIIKQEIVKGVVGRILHWLGAYPVDRSKATNFVDAVVKVINENESIHICITPEGRRKRVSQFKRGFWFMANKSNIPLVLTRFDFDRKVMEFSDLYWCKDIDKDMEYVWNHFKGIKGFHPDQGVIDDFSGTVIKKA